MTDSQKNLKIMVYEQWINAIIARIDNLNSADLYSLKELKERLSNLPLSKNDDSFLYGVSRKYHIDSNYYYMGLIMVMQPKYENFSIDEK